MEREWVLTKPPLASWEQQFAQLPKILRQLLWNRGLRTQEEIEQFLHPNFQTDLHDPFLFRQMRKAVTRILAALKQGETIFVYGDYDADGVPGAVILKTTLEEVGRALALSAAPRIQVYIPHREKEGYGLNSGAIAYILEQGGKLVITCDCGISNVLEVAEAQAKGLDVIITDHHRIPESVPQSFAILHPLLDGEQYPNKFLTGGGVAFKLAQALLRECKTEEGFEKWLLDLVAISTVADVGKLLGENRTLVKYGLVVLNKTRRIGLRKLMEVAGVARLKLSSGEGNFGADTYSIGWQIAPRINAAGRMEHANTAFALLTTSEEVAAETLAEQLNAANTERQKATDLALKQARQELSATMDQAYLLAAFNASWNAGVIGLVAGKLMEEFRRPVLIGTRNEQGLLVVSARSINEFNIIEALASSQEYLLKFGGHPKAAGFSIASEEKWRALVAHLQELARKALHETDVRQILKIDADLTLAQLDWELVAAVQSLEPYGEANPRPRFLLHGLQVLGFDGVGNGGKHLRLRVTDETRRPQKMIGFNCGEWCARLTVGDLLDVVGEVGVNTWNGEREIEFKIVDLRLHRE